MRVNEINPELKKYYEKGLSDVRRSNWILLSSLALGAVAPFIFGVEFKEDDFSPKAIAFMIGFVILLLWMSLGYYLYIRRRYARFHRMLEKKPPIELEVVLRKSDNDGDLCYNATVFPPERNARGIKKHDITMCPPDWDISGLLNRKIKAKAYLHEQKDQCVMIRTESGLLVREYYSKAYF